ncbi:DUF2920 family protein, partial [Campylobacter jejuni]|nr:DUF2920 family protein [Campylobacter jejuni]
ARQSIDQKYNPKLIPNQDDLERVNGILKNINLGHLSVNKDNFEQIIPLIEQKVNKMKQAGLVDESQKIELSCDFIPPNGDYQNYGIMAAIDHINALKDLVKRFPKFADLPKIYGGGSYGGYLALLIAKIAPWYVDGGIDNSGTVLPLLECIIGKDLSRPEFFFSDLNKLVGMFIKTYWTREDERLSYFFTNENYMIRSLLNSSHLTIQASVNKNIILVSYHSLKDPFNTAKDKQTLFLAYKELGYDATLHLIKDESEIDGRFIKDLNHGMRIT